jgi:hypothetical protein
MDKNKGLGQVDKTRIAFQTIDGWKDRTWASSIYVVAFFVCKNDGIKA